LTFTLEIFLRKEQIDVNFEINFQCERGLTVSTAQILSVGGEDIRLLKKYEQF